MSDSTAPGARYPLRAVIRRTGLSADVLRAWERRYGAVRPLRSAGGQRLYTEADVDRLVLLQRATAAGHSIGEIARHDRDALEALLQRPVRASMGGAASLVDGAVRDALAATERLDGEALESLLRRAALSAGSDVLIEEVVPRFLQAVGDRWHRGALSPAHEHLATSTVRRVVGWVASEYERAAGAPRIVVATPAGEQHEVGAQLVAAVAAAERWRVVYLGANLPAGDIVAAASQVGAAAVALSVVYSDSETTRRELARLAEALPTTVWLVVGGKAAARVVRTAEVDRLRVLDDLAGFRELLRSGVDGEGESG